MSSIGEANATDANATTAEAGGSGIEIINPEQVSEIGVFIIWMMIQFFTKNLCWHLFLGFIQIVRVLIIGEISKMILVCDIMIVSDGWSQLLGTKGKIV